MALPAMNWALTAPEQIIAVSTEESTDGRESAIQSVVSAEEREASARGALHGPHRSLCWFIVSPARRWLGFRRPQLE